jgi:hypothetical protein
MELTDAERQLIALLRGEKVQNLSVEIRTMDGIWYAKLWDHAAKWARHGQGTSFSRAWSDTLE